jgi:putative DNA primase/helicase
MNPKNDHSRKPPTMRIDPSGIPSELKTLRQWVRWRWEWGEKRKAWTKVPIQPTRDRKASTTNPKTWGAFKDALSHVGIHGTDGIGFVFTPDDPYCGVDLDSCRNPETGEIAPAAVEITRGLDSFTEASPTGTGVHVIVRGALPGGAGRKRGWLEVYDRGRYFAFTGAVIEHD